MQKLHTKKIPIDAFAIYRRIFQNFVGKGIHPVHVEEILQVLTTKGFFTVESGEDHSFPTEGEHDLEGVVVTMDNECGCEEQDLEKIPFTGAGAVWRLDNECAKTGTLRKDGWPRYTLSPGYKQDFDTAAVAVLSSDDEPLKIFSSMHDTALNKFALDRSAILRVLFRKQSSHKGLRFKWAVDLNEFEKEELDEQLDDEVMRRLEYLTNPLTGGGRKDADKAVSIRKTNRISSISSKLSGIYEVDDVHYSRKRLQSLLRTEDEKTPMNKKQKVKRLAGHDYDHYFPISVRAYCARHEVDVHNFHAEVEDYQKPPHSHGNHCDISVGDANSGAGCGGAGCGGAGSGGIRSRSNCSITCAYSTTTTTTPCSCHKDALSVFSAATSGDVITSERNDHGLCSCQNLDVFLQRCRKLSLQVGSIVKAKISCVSFVKADVKEEDIDNEEECSDTVGYSSACKGADTDTGTGDEYIDHYGHDLDNNDDTGSPTQSSFPGDVGYTGETSVVKTVCIVSRSDRDGHCVVFDGSGVHDLKEDDIVSSPWVDEQDDLTDKWYAHRCQHPPFVSPPCNSSSTDTVWECSLLRDWEIRLRDRQEQQWTETEVDALLSAIGPRHRRGAPNMTRVHRILEEAKSSSICGSSFQRSKRETLRTYFSYFCVKNPHQKYVNIKAVFRCAERLLKKRNHQSNFGDSFDCKAWSLFYEANFLERI